LPMLRKAVTAHLFLLLAIVLAGREASPASPPTQVTGQRVVSARNTIFSPRHRLLRLIPEVNFNEAELPEILAFLSQEAGVNIVISPLAYVRVAAPFASGSPTAAAKKTQFLGAPEGACQQKPREIPAEGRPSLPGMRGITLRLKNVPLKVVLKYVLSYKNLRYIVEDYAIVIAPMGWVRLEALTTQVFRLRTGSFDRLRPTRQAAGRLF